MHDNVRGGNSHRGLNDVNLKTTRGETIGLPLEMARK